MNTDNTIVTGRVKAWNKQRGFGFIAVEHERDVFVHVTKLANVRELEAGQEVRFEIQEGDKGPRAVNVRAIERIA